jgi:hypothetical protein
MEMPDLILNIIQALVSIITWPFKKLHSIMKIQNIQIKQKAKHLEDVKGMSLTLQDGEDAKLKNINIEQDAEIMRNTTGLEFKIDGKQKAKLENVEINSPIGNVKISKGVTINKQ